MKQRVRFELRIVFRHHQESRERTGEFSLRGLEFLERGGIVEHFGRGLDTADLGASVGDAEQHVLLLLGKTFNRIDQVRHQIGAALILVDDLGPVRLDLLVVALDGVVAAIGEAQGRKRRQHRQKSAHQILPFAVFPPTYQNGSVR